MRITKKGGLRSYGTKSTADIKKSHNSSKKDRKRRPNAGRLKISQEGLSQQGSKLIKKEDCPREICPPKKLYTVPGKKVKINEMGGDRRAPRLNERETKREGNLEEHKKERAHKTTRIRMETNRGEPNIAL